MEKGQARILGPIGIECTIVAVPIACGLGPKMAHHGPVLPSEIGVGNPVERRACCKDVVDNLNDIFPSEQDDERDDRCSIRIQDVAQRGLSPIAVGTPCAEALDGQPSFTLGIQACLV
jgi:hypothetical protein